MTTPGPAGRPLLAGAAGGAGWTYVGLASMTVLSLVATSVVLRSVSESEYGVFALAVVVTGMLASLDAGLALGVVHSAARTTDPDLPEDAEARRGVHASHACFLGLALAVGLVAAVLVAVLPLAVDSLRDLQATARWTIAILGVAAVFNMATATYSGLAVGHRRFRLVGTSMALGACTNLALVLLLVERLGVVASALGGLLSAVVSRVLLIRSVRRLVPWFRFRPRRVSRAELGAVASFGAPLLGLSIAGQAVTSTDAIVLGIFTTAGAVGLYRVGMLIPTQVSTLLYRGYDTIFPALVAHDDGDEQELATSFLTRFASFIAGSIFGTLAACAAGVVVLLSGQESALAASVLVVFCATWLCNVTIHGLALLLIARGRQGVLVRAALLEAVVNLALTVVLVLHVGPLGAALATLIAFGVSHFVVLPLRARHELSRSVARLIFRDGVLPAAIGGVVSLGVASGCLLLDGPLLAQMALAASVALVLTSGLGWCLLGSIGRSTTRNLLPAGRNRAQDRS